MATGKTINGLVISTRSGVCLLLAYVVHCNAQQALVNQLRNLAVTADSTFTFDISFELAIPSEGDSQITLQFDLTISVTFSNSSIAFKPIAIPYLIAPETRPIVFEIGSEKNYDQPAPPKYAYDPYAYDAYYGHGSPYFQPDDGQRRNLLVAPEKTRAKSKSTNNKKRKKKKKKKSKSNKRRQAQDYHYRNRRSLAATSAQHRADLFSMLSGTLEAYGLDGQACVCRAVCELAEMEMVIESPVHEIIEHILRVSRANDNEGVLQEYLQAEKYGHHSRQLGQSDLCAQRYSECPFTIFQRDSD